MFCGNITEKKPTFKVNPLKTIYSFNTQHKTFWTC